MRCFKYLRGEQMMEQRLMGKSYEESMVSLQHKNSKHKALQAESYSEQSHRNEMSPSRDVIEQITL